MIMDDESYFKYDFSTLAGVQYCSARKQMDVPEKDRTIAIEKFGRKVLFGKQYVHAVCVQHRFSKKAQLIVNHTTQNVCRNAF